MLRRILTNKTFRLSSLNSWRRTSRSSVCDGKDEDKVSSSEPESTKQLNTVPEINTVLKQQLENEQSESEKNVVQLLESAATYSDVDNKDWATLPYPGGVPGLQESVPPERPDPTEASIILFPGQGTITVGMAEKYLHFPKARELFEYSSEIVKYDLLKLCLKGPEEKLNRTDYNQVATVVCSLAALEKLAEERPKVFEKCVGVAGYSIGELTALIFSGALSFEDGIKLVMARGNAMLRASEMEPQGMLAVTLSHSSKLSEVLRQAKDWALNNGVSKPVCQIAIYVYTEGRVLGGHDIALKYIESNAKAFGLSNVKRLPVSGAFHTPLMEPALKQFKNALYDITIDEPRVKVYSNFTGDPHSTPKNIQKNLIKQITKSVKWEQCMQLILSRPRDTAFPRIFDVGSQGRLKLILRQTNLQAAKSCYVY